MKFLKKEYKVFNHTLLTPEELKVGEFFISSHLLLNIYTIEYKYLNTGGICI